LTAASHSIDVILPYLDPRVVKFGLTIDGTLKLKPWNHKYILRKVAEQLMPLRIGVQTEKSTPVRTGISTVLRNSHGLTSLTTSATVKGAVGIYLRSVAEKRGIRGGRMITKTDVEQIAWLACLELDEEDMQAFTISVQRYTGVL